MYRIATVLLAVSVAFGMRLSASAETVEKVDPTKNLLVNGGAERGWYGTAQEVRGAPA